MHMTKHDMLMTVEVGGILFVCGVVTNISGKTISYELRRSKVGNSKDVRI
jgi:hypothetical protein